MILGLGVIKDKMINYISGLISGICLYYLYWMGTHNCYMTIAGVLCSTHSFSFDFLYR